MKNLTAIIICACLLLTLCACNQQQAADTTTSTTTPTTPSSTYLPSLNQETVMAALASAYTAYAEGQDSPAPMTQILFIKDNEYLICLKEDTVYRFFPEGVIEENKLGEAEGYTLYLCISPADVMMDAMKNAWNQYVAQCAQDRITTYPLSLYYFECDFFYGQYAIDDGGNLIQSNIFQGSPCGTFGNLTIYVQQNADQAVGGTQTDAEILVEIRNTYDLFAQDCDLQSLECLSIENYAFYRSGTYYQVTDSLEIIDASIVHELAISKTYNGWQVYLILPAPTE